MSCGVGCRRGSDPVLLWLWHRPVATAPIQPLVWEVPYATGVAQEKAKNKTKQNKTKDIGNKLEAKMDNLEETLTKEIQDIKLKQEEMQNTINEIKNSLDAANSRIQEAEERISKVEDRLVEIMDAEQKREKRLKRNEESLRELWDKVKRTNIRIIGVPEGEEKEKGTEKIFQEIIAKNFPHMGKESLTQIQEAQRVPYKINPRRNAQRHKLIKLTKIKDKEKILKAAREKKNK
uniref:L1 transposable element RRM domain-containing protein n=1 Tax=Sus scrofa TaxID=9823 RepID=A0A8D0S463_PIG